MNKYDAAREDAENFGRDDEPEGDYVGIGRNGPAPRAVAPVETPRCPFGYTKEMPGTKHDCAIHKSSDYDAQTRLTAEQFLSSRLEPDPNEPDEDTYWLRFPNGVECVENRAFWEKHLAELLEAFRDKSEEELREENERLHDTAIRQQEICIQWADQWATHDAVLAELRAKLAQQERCTTAINLELSDLRTKWNAAEAEAAALRERERLRKGNEND